MESKITLPKLSSFSLFCLLIMINSGKALSQDDDLGLAILKRTAYFYPEINDTTYIYKFQRGCFLCRKNNLILDSFVLNQNDTLSITYSTVKNKFCRETAEIADNTIIEQQEFFDKSTLLLDTTFQSILFFTGTVDFILIGSDTNQNWSKTDSVVFSTQTNECSVDSIFGFDYSQGKRTLKTVVNKKGKEVLFEEYMSEGGVIAQDYYKYENEIEELIINRRVFTYRRVPKRPKFHEYKVEILRISGSNRCKFPKKDIDIIKSTKKLELVGSKSVDNGLLNFVEWRGKQK